MYKLLDLLFGCSHKHLTFPRSAKGHHQPQAAVLTGMYVVCLDCGKEFPYDWREMKVLLPTAQEEDSVSGTQIAKHAA